MWVHKLALGAKVGNRLLTYKPERDMEWFLGGERHNQTFQRLAFEKHFKEIPLLVALTDWSGGWVYNYQSQIRERQ